MDSGGPHKRGQGLDVASAIALKASDRKMQQICMTFFFFFIKHSFIAMTVCVFLCGFNNCNMSKLCFSAVPPDNRAASLTM